MRQGGDFGKISGMAYRRTSVVGRRARIAGLALVLIAAAAPGVDLNGVSLDVDDSTFALDGEYTNSSDTPASLVVTLSANATFTGTMSGNLQLVKKGAGKLTVSSANSFTGGTDIQAGTVGITDADALGTGDVSVLGSAAAAGRISLDAAITFTNNISVASGVESFAALYFGLTSGTAVYSGDISVTGGMLLRRAAKNGIGRFAGTVRTSGDVTVGGSNAEGGWYYYFDGRLIIKNGSGTLNHNQANSAVASFGHADNEWAYTKRYTQGPAFTVPHSIPTNSYMSSNQSTHAPSISFTGDQKFRYAKSRNSDKTVTITANSGTAATLELWPSASTQMNEGYNLNGPLSVIFNPASDDVVWRIRGGTSSMTGSLTVARGTVVVATNTFSSITGFNVASGARLELGDKCTVGAVDGLRVTVADGGVFKLAPGVVLSVAELRLGGARAAGGRCYVQDAEGSWTSMTLEQAELLSDSGYIYAEVYAAEETAATWTAGGGADERMSVAANWGAESTPDLEGSGLLATFGSAGTNAVVDGAYALRGVVFDAAETNFSISASSGESALSLHSAGVVTSAPGDGKTRAYSLSAPVNMLVNQYWTVAADTTLSVCGPVSSDTTPTLHKGGPGALILSATNTFTGNMDISNGAVRVYSGTNAFGAAGGTVYLRQSSGATMAVKASTVIDKDFQFLNAKDKNGWTVMASGTTCEFARSFRCNTNWRPSFGGTVIFSGGAEISNYFIPASGRMVFRTVPCYFGVGFNLQGGQIDFEVGGNTFQTGFEVNGGNSVNLYAENVFGASTVVRLGNYNANSCPMTIYNGANQRMGDLLLLTAASSVTAREPMTLTVNQASASTWKGDIAGGVTLVKGGAATVTINRSMSSTGDVAVANGALVFGASGRWQGAKTVAVSNATLSVAAESTFADDIVLHTSGTGAVSIAEGVVVKAAEWYHDGIRQRYASYTSSNSGGHVSGPGSLVVGSGGLVVIFR